MKKLNLLSVLAGVCALSLVFIGCGGDDDNGGDGGGGITYVNFPEEEILRPSFYIGDSVSTENCNVVKDGDVYKVTVTARAEAKATSIRWSGPFTFSKHYQLKVSLPSDSTVKPKEIYGFASIGSDSNTEADYTRAYQDANDPEGDITVSNGDVALPDMSSKYKSVFLYLYFDTQYAGQSYTFTVKELKAANGVAPRASIVKAVSAYRSEGWSGPQFDIGDSPLAGWDYKYDSGIVEKKSPSWLEIDFKFPNDAVGKEYKFTLTNAGIYAEGDTTTNLLDETTILGGAVYVSGGATNQTNVVTKVSEGVYSAKVKAVEYDSLFGGAGVGAKFYIPGTYTDSVRFTLTLNLSKEFEATP
jgi:hypothetical protein